MIARPPIVFTQRRPGPIVVRASASVRSEALDVAAARIARLVDRAPGVAANLARAGAELQVIGEAERVTDLPQYLHMRGVPFDGERTMDERGRGYGGLHACCAEEALLELPSARHRDHRDVCSHEVAHTILDFGLDTALRERVRACFEAAREQGLWEGCYAATNPAEYFAELTMWYVGSHGDRGPGAPEPGTEALRAYDPASFALLHALYTGAVEPRALRWDLLEPTRVERSASGDRATSIVFENRMDHPLALFWLDHQGHERAYGTVPAGALRSQSTFEGHPWVLRGQAVHGPYVPGPDPGRVVIGPALRG